MKTIKEQFQSRLDSLEPLMGPCAIRESEILRSCIALKMCIETGIYDGDVLRQADDIFCVEKRNPTHEYAPETPTLRLVKS